ncbi:MAG: hypothetical protein KGL91_11030 [Xanthomonadaceae bacterium]|nr:hypothetical protein [Xanthomonadaceae bacterium]
MAATLVVVATLAAAIWAMGSPAKQRDRRIDQRRTQQLEAIADAVDVWVLGHKRLPASLADLANQPGASLVVADPVDGKPYGYHVTSGSGYQLCARFSTSTADRNGNGGGFNMHEKRWLHPAGLHCFDRTVTKSAADALEAVAKP